MPVTPEIPFHKVTCAECGWSHTSVQRSDVILSPRTCGKCSSTVLQHSVPCVAEAMLAETTAFLKHVLHGR